jgi:hypothetical protein
LSHPEIQVEHTQSQAIAQEKSLPFYELMTPIPSGDTIAAIPSLEYKKGPPDRYIEKISLLFFRISTKDKERAIYYGRRTEPNRWLSLGMHLGGFAENSQEANFLSSAIEFSTTGHSLELPFFVAPLVKIAMLQVADPYLTGVKKVLVQDQAGTPAFLFIHEDSDNSQKRASAYFFRRDSQFRVDYLADRNFSILKPEDIFAKSFLVAKRQDTLEFVGRNLSEVHFAASGVESIGLKETSWPLALLAATLSVDPSSIDAYFHFAGLSALLFKSKELQTNDTEVLDALRNNVLAAGFYAQDVLPQSFKASEIARLARTLTRNIE